MITAANAMYFSFFATIRIDVMVAAKHSAARPVKTIFEVVTICLYFMPIVIAK